MISVQARALGSSCGSIDKNFDPWMRTVRYEMSGYRVSEPSEIRQRRIRQNVARRAAEHQLTQTALRVSALHQEIIAAERGGVIENALRRCRATIPASTANAVDLDAVAAQMARRRPRRRAPSVMPPSTDSTVTLSARSATAAARRRCCAPVRCCRFHAIRTLRADGRRHRRRGR